jgi:hypothetical protein
MAIGKPKAIDDAPLAGRSAAEDGSGETFLHREEWASAQGKKVDPPPLRLRRSRRSRPSARLSQKEAVWFARRIASSGEDVADVECHPQESGIPGQGKEALAHSKDGVMTNHPGQGQC